MSVLAASIKNKGIAPRKNISSKKQSNETNQKTIKQTKNKKQVKALQGEEQESILLKSLPRLMFLSLSIFLSLTLFSFYYLIFSIIILFNLIFNLILLFNAYSVVRMQIVMQSQFNTASKNKFFSRCELPSAHWVRPSNILTFLALMQ